MTINEELTQPKYAEEWAVSIGKETFILNEFDIKILKQASLGGEKGIVWFEKFAISIPHIQSIYLISKRIKNQIESGEKKEPTIEEREKASEKVKEIRKKFKEKLGL